ncbi:MAG: hypothetical protein HZC42_00765 [Candidatus Eisenbacteria bacterium]|nr:hypothetical protein [Candidatus Eisenbacteria bacterium]
MRAERIYALSISMSLLSLSLVLVAPRSFAPPSGASPPRVLREVPVARILVGSGPDRISDVGCDDCGDICGGAPFLGPDGTVYFIDFAHNNLKALPASGAGRIRVVPGPPLQAQNDQPTDGTVGEDGTIYLLADRTTHQNRYRVYYRRPSDTTWQEAESLDDSDIGWTEIGGKRVPAGGTTRIGVNSGGQVEVYGLDRRKSPAIVVGDRRGPLRAAARTRLAPGALLRRGLVVRTSGSATAIGPSSQAPRIETPGAFLGTDSQDNIYLRAPGRESGVDILQRYDPSGRLLASGTVPARPTQALVEGKGAFQVSASGDVYQFRLTTRGLEVTRWTTEATP